MTLLTDEYLKELDEALFEHNKYVPKSMAAEDIDCLAKAARILQSIAPHLNAMVGAREGATQGPWVFEASDGIDGLSGMYLQEIEGRTMLADFTVSDDAEFCSTAANETAAIMEKLK